MEKYNTAQAGRPESAFGHRLTSSGVTMKQRGLKLTLLLAGATCASPAYAQAAPNLVSACSGVSLPRSTVTDIITPVVTGIAAPTQNTVNSLLDLLGNPPFVPALQIDTTGLLNDAASGAPVTLQVLNRNGQVVGPDDRCDLQADSVGLNTAGGIAIGGNRITGLGNNGLDATAGTNDSIALGDSANTDASSANSISIGRGASVGPNSPGALALGNGARAEAGNSLALGTNSVADRGAVTSYVAPGLAAAQTSSGEVSVGAPGGERQITNVAAGSAPTDAVNVEQLLGIADQVGALQTDAVQYDDPGHATVTLDAPGGTRITNVAPGAVTATSRDAVNGAQLFATNQAVTQNTLAITSNTNAITNLSVAVANGGTGPVQYSNPAAPTVPNGGVPTNDLTLVGGASGAVGLHNVANGTIAAGSTDAVNGGQIYGLALTTLNAVSYNTDANGNRTNTVTLVGGNATSPVSINNVADGTVAAGSTQAVNGGQLNTTNQAVTAAQATAGQALALGQNSVQYDNAGRTSVTLGGVGGGNGPVAVHGVAAGTSATDAVNVAQLAAGTSSAVTQANAYTDGRFAAVNYDMRVLRRDSRAGTAGALAAAGLPQAYEPGKGMIALGGGTYRGQSAFAVGFSKAFDDGHTVVKISGSYDTRGNAGASGGVGYQF